MLILLIHTAGELFPGGQISRLSLKACHFVLQSLFGFILRANTCNYYSQPLAIFAIRHSF